MSFKIGDKVQWTGHAGGYSRQHVGTVVGIIQRNQYLEDVVVTLPGSALLRRIYREEFPKGFLSGHYPSPRPGESYLVKVGNRKRLYWPHASKLRLVLTPEAVNAAVDALTEVQPVLDPFTDPFPGDDNMEGFRAALAQLIAGSDEFMVAAYRREDGALRVSGHVTPTVGLVMVQRLLEKVTDLA
jgi:hypothetical protein